MRNKTKYNYNIIRNHDETSKICYEKKSEILSKIKQLYK